MILKVANGPYLATLQQPCPLALGDWRLTRLPALSAKTFLPGMEPYLFWNPPITLLALLKGTRTSVYLGLKLHLQVLMESTGC
jgi:hypothetical protein